MRKLFLIPIIISTALAGAGAQVKTPVDSGYYYYQQGDYGAAIFQFSKAIEMQPENAEAYYLRGVCKSELGKNREAIADYDKALQVRPDFPEVHFEKGYAFFLMSNYEKAIASFDRALILNPKYTEALVNRGSVKCIIGEKQEAEEDWQKAKQLGAQLPYFKCE